MSSTDQYFAEMYCSFLPIPGLASSTGWHFAEIYCSLRASEASLRALRAVQVGISQKCTARYGLRRPLCALCEQYRLAFRRNILLITGFRGLFARFASSTDAHFPDLYCSRLATLVFSSIRQAFASVRPRSVLQYSHNIKQRELPTAIPSQLFFFTAPPAS